MFGWQGTILVIDLTTGKITKTPWILRWPNNSSAAGASIPRPFLTWSNPAWIH